MLINTTFFAKNRNTPSEIEIQGTGKTLSTVIVEIMTLACISVLGLNTIVVLVAQIIRIPFSTYLIICPMISLMALVGTGIIGLYWLRSVGTHDYDVVVKLLLLSLVFLILGLLSSNGINYFDNYLYVPNAVYFLSHPHQPMDFQIHFFIGESGSPIISPNQATSLAYEYFRAVIAYYTHIEFLASYFYSGAVMLSFIPPALFLLINRFVEDTKRAMSGTFVSMALILISACFPSRTISLFLLNMSFGKFVLLSSGIFIFASYSLAFFQKPSRMMWLSLFLCTLTLVGMTASATVLIGILAILLLSTFIFTSWINTRPQFNWKYIFLHAGLYLSSLVFIFIYVLFLYWMLKSGATTGNYTTLETSHNFINQLEIFSNLQFPLTLILMMASPIIVFLSLKGWQRQFLLIWMFSLAIFFLNPIGMNLFIDTVVPSNIYWRLFFLFPFPLAIGVASTRLPISKFKSIFEIALIILSLALYLVGKPYPRFLPYDMYIENFQIAQKIVKIAPHGGMLAPPELYGVIPMIDGFHPQVATRLDAIDLWFVNPREHRIRMHSASFVTGGFVGDNPIEFIQDFSELIKRDFVRTVVMNNTVLTNSTGPQVKIILTQKGFLHQKRIGNYVIFWK